MGLTLIEILLASKFTIIKLLPSMLTLLLANYPQLNFSSPVMIKQLFTPIASSYLLQCLFLLFPQHFISMDNNNLTVDTSSNNNIPINSNVTTHSSSFVSGFLSPFDGNRNRNRNNDNNINNIIFIATVLFDTQSSLKSTALSVPPPPSIPMSTTPPAAPSAQFW